VEPRPPFYLVDLPGFGYARGGDKAREEFDALAADYFGARLNDPRFRGVFVLVDSRHPGLDSDRSTWNWLDRHGVVRHVVATKVDKLTRSDRQRHLGELERLYSGPVTPVSAETGEGLDALWKMSKIGRQQRGRWPQERTCRRRSRSRGPETQPKPSTCRPSRICRPWR
jgi:GTP-binding protein EngB required for normal cell division